MSTGIVWDDRRWRRRMSALRRQYQTAPERAGAQVARQVLEDCVNEPPTVPIDTGHLRSSGTFEVLRPSDTLTRIYVGYNTPYAARVHEHPMNFREPSAGNKYLGAKLHRHAKEYVRLWARKARQAVTALPWAAGGGGGGTGV